VAQPFELHLSRRAPPLPSDTHAMTTTPPLEGDGDLVVVTLNVWGLLGLSKQREQRVDALCEWLADPLRHQRPPAANSSSSPNLLPFAADFWRARPVSLVLLQEVWVASDAARLAAAARRGGLAHSMHFCSGAFGAGLLTLSAHPIAAARLHTFSARGDPCAVFSGDFYAAKGCGWCKVELPGGKGDLHVFNTHLCSNYRHTFRPLPLLPAASESAAAAEQQQEGGGRRAALRAARQAALEAGDSGVRVPTDADAATRVAQVLELCDFVREAAGLGLAGEATGGGGGMGGGGGGGTGSTPPPRILLAGDLNSEPDTLEVAVLRARLPELADAWAETVAWRAGGHHSGAAGGTTSAGGRGDPEVEGYTLASPLNTYRPRRQVPERIDYVWSTLAPRAAALDLARVPGGGGCSYSDHLAVRAALALATAGAGSDAASGAAAATAPPLLSEAVRMAAATPTPKSPGVAALLLRRARGGVGGNSGGGGALPAGNNNNNAAAADHEEASSPAGVARAALVGAAVVLAEGAEEFAGLASGNTLLGGLAVISSLYTAAALPFCAPDFIRWAVLSSRGAMAAVAVALVLAGGGGFALFVAGFFAARSQQTALTMALRSHVLRMRRSGLCPSSSGE
jgi:endonuclease/exonuclease/phosphatase family metal-dependent hydrolase